MAWTAPKTDWTADSYIDASHATVWVDDLKYLHDAIIDAGGSFTSGWSSLSFDTEYSDALSGSEYTAIEWDLWHCAKAIYSTLGCSTNYFPSYMGWSDNASTPDYQRLNQVGEALVNIYNYLQTL